MSKHNNYRKKIKYSKEAPPNALKKDFNLLDLKEDNENVYDIMKLMLNNIKDIKQYFSINKKQAVASFVLAAIMSIFGGVLMGASAVIAFYYSEKMTAAILAAICAMILEIIAGIALMLYKKSMEQLKCYFDWLCNSERLLSIISLVDQVSLENRDDIYYEIIRCQNDSIAKGYCKEE